MKKSVFFRSFRGEFWPSREVLQGYFDNGSRWLDNTSSDSGGIDIQGVEGTAELPKYGGRIDIGLDFVGSPKHGVFLMYRKFGGGINECYYSKGNMSKIKKYMRTTHDDLRPIGLFIPFEKAWLAVEDFMRGDGALSSRIEWVDANDLPENTFPMPHEDVDETP